MLASPASFVVMKRAGRVVAWAVVAWAEHAARVLSPNGPTESPCPPLVAAAPTTAALRMVLTLDDGTVWRGTLPSAGRPWPDALPPLPVGGGGHVVVTADGHVIARSTFRRVVPSIRESARRDG